MSRFVKAFQQVRDKLVNEIDVSHGLWTALEVRKVLTSRQLRDCQRFPIEEEKVEKMLQLLERRDDQLFESFCEALIITDQKPIVDKYLQQCQLLSQEADENQYRQSSPNCSCSHKLAKRPQNSDDSQESKRCKTLNNETTGTDVDVDDDVDFVDVKVLHTTEEFYRNHYESAYSLYRRCRGSACIINIFQTFEMSDRRGTQVDCDRLTKLFDQLHFSVKVYNDSDDLTVEGILEKIAETSNEEVNGKWPQCYVLFILSHGGKAMIDGCDTEVVFGTDGKPLSKKMILSALSDDKCPNLRRLPRLVFFQSCRGDTFGVTDEIDAPGRQVQGDFLVCHPCQQDFVSLRNPVKGSRYVRCLVDVFMNNAHDKDIFDLLTMLHEKLEKLVLADKRHQIPDFTSSLRKKLFFFPGYVE